jgi:hypothetical protein
MRIRLHLLWLFLATVSIVGCAPDKSTTPGSTADYVGQDDVTFFGAGKVARYQQGDDGSLENMGPLFFAEIFIAAGGEITDASIQFPQPVGDTRELLFRHSESGQIGDVMYLSGIADTIDELEQKFPRGEYFFRFKTGGGSVINQAVSFNGRTFAKQPVIIFKQDDRVIAMDEVDTTIDLVITWPPFSEGQADTNGILDDLIFVAIDSCMIEDIVHSGRPFEKDDYLTFRATDYVVGAGTLLPGQAYSMYVEHAILAGTQEVSGIPAFATLAASTYMEFRTMGETDPNYCDEQT